ETSIPGIFACGNGLHIHDVVDFVSEEGDTVAKSVERYLTENMRTVLSIPVKSDSNFIYVLPQTIDKNQSVKLKFRVRKPLKNVKVVIKSNDEILMTLPKTQILPAEMEMITIPLQLMDKIQGEIRLEILS
ncbi:MAG: hypothetical protein ACYDEI_06425, partial [Erysipelotrichaceae bacterium]